MSRRHYLAALALFLCVQPAAADNPKKVAISPGSPKGALMFKAPPFWIDQLLLFIRDDPDTSSSREYWIAILNRPTAKGDSILVNTLPPGRYRLEAVYQQDKWVACLQANTLKVTIEPGKIAYLGTLETRPTLASIQRNATASKELRAYMGQWHFYRTNIDVPLVLGRDTEDLAQAEIFVRQQMPKSSALPELADIQWAPYESSKPSGRANRCV